MNPKATIRKRAVRRNPEEAVCDAVTEGYPNISPVIADHDPLMSVKDVAAYLSVGEPTIWEYARTQEGFPKPFKLTPKCSRWRKSKINKWITCREDDV